MQIDWRLCPLLAFLYLVSYIDKASIGGLDVNCNVSILTMLGNAKIEGMLTDLDMSGTQYNVALGIFFVTYVLFGR